MEEQKETEKCKPVSSIEKHDEKHVKECISSLPRNVIREYSVSLSPFWKEMIGHYYLLLHNVIIILGCFIFLFSDNIFYLSALLNMIILDCICIVFAHDCPLTNLEKKYLNTSLVEIRQNSLKDLGIVYECNHEYEKQLELLINLWSFISLKIIFLILMNMLNIKIYPA